MHETHEITQINHSQFTIHHLPNIDILNSYPLAYAPEHVRLFKLLRKFQLTINSQHEVDGRVETVPPM